MIYIVISRVILGIGVSMPVIEEVVACMLVGIMSLLFGLWQIKTRSFKHIHPKYLKNVKEQDKPTVALLTGIGISVVGVGCILLAPSLLYRNAMLGFWGVIFLFSGLFIALISIGLYNGRYS